MNERWRRLSDPDISRALMKWARSLTKEQALAWLKQHGFLTKTGRTPKKYGG